MKHTQTLLWALASRHQDFTNAPHPLQMDAISVSRSIHNGTLTATELMEKTLSRIRERNPIHNAIIAMKDDEYLMELAAAADRCQATKKGWLHGIPMAVKDLFDVKGFPTTYGGSPLHNITNASASVATANSPFVQNLVDAGAIIVGKTNTPESGLGSHTYNSMWGVTRNTYDPLVSAGGSSGGAAVAVATGMLLLADGSDMMGSLRNPAGWNGLYSLRPTAVSNDNDSASKILPYQISMMGPIARTVEDLKALHYTMMYGIKEVVARSESEQRMNSDKERVFKVAWLRDWGGAYAIETGILETCEAFLDLAGESDDVEIHRFGRQDSLFPANDLWKSWTTIRSALIAQTEIEKYGMDALLGPSSKVKTELQWEVQRGINVSQDQLDDAKDIASRWSQTVEHITKEYDILSLPSSQVWPFPVEMKWPEMVGDAKMDTYHRWMEVVVPASLAGLPVLTVPTGLPSVHAGQPLPVGLQLIGRRNDEESLFRVGEIFQRCRQNSPRTR